MLRVTITAVVSILTYFFFLEEYNYPSYSAFGMAVVATLLCFILWEDYNYHKKRREEKKWDKYRHRLIETTSDNVEQKKSTKEVKAEDYNFLFSMTTNNNEE